MKIEATLNTPGDREPITIRSDESGFWTFQGEEVTGGPWKTRGGATRFAKFAVASYETMDRLAN